MIKRIGETFVLIILAIVIPLIGHLSLLLTWPVLITVLYGILLVNSQPTMVGTKAKTEGHDRSSMTLILIGAIFCFVIPIVEHAYFRPKIITLQQLSTWLGIVFIFGGFLFRYYSIRILGRFFTSKVEIQSDHELVQEGPYKIIRHPSYTGAWFSMVGVSLLFQSKIGLVFTIFIYFLIYIYRIECEEKALQGMFGEKYRRYQEKTWRMFPYIY